LLCKPIEPDALHQTLARWLPGLSDAPVPTTPEQDEDSLRGLEMNGVDFTQTNHKTREQYLHLLSLYALDARKNGNLYRRRVTQDTCDAYRIWVHALKSASANIGAMELSALAKKQEEAAKHEDLDAIAQGAPVLFAHYDAVVQEINRVLQAQTETAAAEQTLREPISLTQLKKDLGQALDYLEDFEAKESAKVVEHLLQCDLSQTTRHTLDEVKEKLQLYEDDEAETLLRQAIAQAS
jgi:HPt (histidine-containing phosphotransfer) domain-containing protein